MKKLALVAPPGQPAPDALDVLAAELAPRLRKILGLDVAGALVDVTERCAALPRRATLAACRRGEIAGAVKRGRRWLAQPEAIDQWLRSSGPKLVTDATDDEFADLRRAMVRKAGQR